MPSPLKNGLLVVVTAEALIGSSLVWDKVLLKRPGTQNVFSYVFWLGALSALGILLIPFGYRTPPFRVIAIALFTGLVNMVANLAYYMALKYSEASRAVAMLGGFSPVATALIAYALLSSRMTQTDLLAFLLMTSGGFLMFFSETFAFRKMLLAVILAAGLFGLVYVLQRIVYDQTNFITGYVWFTIGTTLASLGLLIPRSWRRQIFSESEQQSPRSRFWYFVNRFEAGIGAFLDFYALSLIHPAVVSAISGERYAIVFLGVIVLTKFRPDWLKENLGGRQLFLKALATALVIGGLVLLGLKGGSNS